MSYFPDTICALTTSINNSVIAIIRVSGDKTLLIVEKLIRKKFKKNIILAKIYDGKKIIDEALFFVFKNPNSYTGENIIEISFHANKIIAKNILLLLFKNGCRIAEKGEFTKRAFLNGKINILQAEAINNLINAKSEITIQSSLKNIENTQYKKIINIRNELIDILGNLEVNIDYPEYYDIKILKEKEIFIRLKKINKILKLFIKNSTFFHEYNNGYKIVIIGKPNSGKSTLFNKILSEERAIISDIEGTTRDFLRENIVINNNNYFLIDTAGINFNTKSNIEKIGIKKTFENIKKANLIIHIYDGNKTQEINNILFNNKKNVINVFNKMDLVDIKNRNEKLIWISAKNNKIDSLTNEILRRIKKIDHNYVIINEFNILVIEEIIKKIENFITEVNSGFYIDVVIIFLKQAYEKINILIGDNLNKKIIDQIFEKFCLGK